ncbi:hypothetical protein Tco_1085068 [Tanacetum coccineum]
MKHSYLNDHTCFSIDVIDEIVEEDFDSLLDEGSKILYSIKGTLLKEEIFFEFDEFMAMTADENSESEFDTSRAVVWNGLPKIIGILVSSRISNITKSTRRANLSTLMSTFSAILRGY